MTPPQGYADKGFTLLEVLVVLVLASLISTILMQGLSQVLQMRMRYLQAIENLGRTSLKMYWIRSVTAALTPGYGTERGVFSGDASSFEGLTFFPLNGSTGTPTLVRIRLAQDKDTTTLHYSENQDLDWTIGRWQADQAQISYLDQDGIRYAEWPPKNRRVTQLPPAIVYTIHTRPEPLSIVCAIAGRLDAKMLPGQAVR
ncbi:MAG: hypothetical protein CSA33_04420 [Desulfobulbus propionicus]|nr:MAG: hypothetical protein CSA33_04420 [Desulfobulbus propionicus]